MEGHNERHTPVTSDGKLSVVLENSDGTPSVVLKKAFVNDHLRKVLSSGPLTPEQLADVLDEPHTRRAWWLDLHSGADLHAGTTISDIQAAVGRAAGSKTATGNGSNGQPAAAPVSVTTLRRGYCEKCEKFLAESERLIHQHPVRIVSGDAPISFGHVAANELTMPVCECSQPVASLIPFDWQCAKCKGVIPSPYVLTDEQRRDYLEAL
jgi:hypothetical protein